MSISLITSKRRLSLIGIVALLLANISLAAPAAFAQEAEAEATRDGIVGEIVSSTVSEDGSGIIVVLTEDGQVTVNLEAGSYNVKTPGSTYSSTTLDAGASVAVLIEDGNAVQILVKPVAPVSAPVTGSVVSIDENGVMTVATPSGKTKTIQLPPQATPPGLGEIVTTFVEDGSGTDDEGDGSGRPSTSTGLVRADEVRQRLSRFVDEALDEGTDTEDGEADDLAALLEGHSTKQVEMLTGILERTNIPEQAKAGIRNALERAATAQIAAKAKADEARARGGRPESGETTGSRPEDAGGSRPEDAGSNRPEDTGGGRPEGTGGGRPEGRGRP